jgi:hypothetical protein
VANVRRIVARLLCLAAATACLAPTGCRSSSPADDKDAADVRKVLLAMHAALVSDDREGYLKLFSGTPAELSVAAAQFDFAAEGYRFQDDVVRAYGTGGWNEFRRRGGARLILPPRDETTWRDMPVRVRGDEADCVIQEDRRPLRMIRQGGQWRVSAASMIPPGGDGETIVRAMHAMTKVVEQFRREVGSPGMTPALLDERMAGKITLAARSVLTSEPASQAVSASRPAGG